jgi:hypothetical protein
MRLSKKRKKDRRIAPILDRTHVVAFVATAAAAVVVIIDVLSDNLVSPLFIVILGQLFSLMRCNFEQVRLKPELGKLYQASAEFIYQNARRQLMSQDLLVQLVWYGFCLRPTAKLSAEGLESTF